MVLDLGEGLKGLRTPIRFSDAELAPAKRSPKLGEGEWPPICHSRESGNPVAVGGKSRLGPRLRGDDEGSWYGKNR